MKSPLVFALVLFCAGFLHAEIQRSEIALKGDWMIRRCTDGDKPAGVEMHRTCPSKHEVHVRLSIAGDGGVYLDTMNSEIGAGGGNAPVVELRVNTREGEPIWKGKGAMLDDPDGLSWLRVDLTEGPEGVLEPLMERGKTLYVDIGSGATGKKWEFDVSGGKEAYMFMWEANQAETEQPAGAGPAGAPAARVEHEYARPGDWAVHYYTKGSGKLASASMIRFFDNGRLLRMSIDATHFHVDMAGNWQAVETSEGRKGDAVPVYIALNEKDDGNGLNRTATLINDEGDKWLRISQPLDEPSGMQDVIRNGKRIHVVFSTEGKWTFPLKGSHAAWNKVEECLAKYGPATK